MREQVSPTAYQTWLARTILIDLAGRQSTILAPNAYLQQRIAERYETPICRAIAALLHHDVTLVVTTITE
ncbi:MAG: hypothetical protein GX601_17225 [Anaerolineales bacterium]|nr:hypothetical protein [Anaerolineales bacterium]